MRGVLGLLLIAAGVIVLYKVISGQWPAAAQAVTPGGGATAATATGSGPAPASAPAPISPLGGLPTMRFLQQNGAPQ